MEDTEERFIGKTHFAGNERDRSRTREFQLRWRLNLKSADVSTNLDRHSRLLQISRRQFVGSGKDVSNFEAPIGANGRAPIRGHSPIATRKMQGHIRYRSTLRTFQFA